MFINVLTAFIVLYGNNSAKFTKETLHGAQKETFRVCHRTQKL